MWEHASEHPASPAMQDAAKEFHFSLTPEYWGVLCDSWWGWGVGSGGEWLEEQQPGLLESIKGIKILLTTSKFPLESPSMSYKGCLTCRSHQLAPKHPQHSTQLTPTCTPLPMASIPCTPPRTMRIWADSLWACAETQTNSVGLEESAQTWAFSTILGKTNRRLSTADLALRDQENAYKLKNFESKGDKSVEQEYLEKKVWKSLKIANKADGKYFFLKAQQERLKEVTVSSNAQQQSKT